MKGGIQALRRHLRLFSTFFICGDALISNDKFIFHSGRITKLLVHLSTIVTMVYMFLSDKNNITLLYLH